MPTVSELSREKYVRFTTFKRDGSSVHTAVWIAPYGEDGACFTTGSDSGKVKRLRHTSRVVVQASDMRGRVVPGSTPVEASAAILEGDDARPVSAAIRRKYGVMFLLIDLQARIATLLKRRRPADAAIVISPNT